MAHVCSAPTAVVGLKPKSLQADFYSPKTVTSAVASASGSHYGGCRSR